VRQLQGGTQIDQLDLPRTEGGDRAGQSCPGQRKAVPSGACLFAKRPRSGAEPAPGGVHGQWNHHLHAAGGGPDDNGDDRRRHYDAFMY
jgi:hypothetical protein